MKPPKKIPKCHCLPKVHYSRVSHAPLLDVDVSLVGNNDVPYIFHVNCLVGERGLM